MTTSESTTSVPAVRGALSARHLVPGERILWEGRPALIVFVLRPVLLTILSITFLIVINGFINSHIPGIWGFNDILLLIAALGISVVMFPVEKITGGFAGIVGIASTLLIAFSIDTFSVLMFAPLVVSILYFLVYYIIWRHIAFALTDRRIISQYGIFNLRYADTQIGRVQNVTVIQPWYERLLGYGDVAFATAGETGGIDYSRPGLRVNSEGAMVWENVRKPFELRKLVEQIIYPSAVAPTVTRATVAASPPSVAPVPAGVSAEERLDQLKRMKEKGLISDAEYEVKRKEILDQL